MKKVLAILLSLVLVLSLTACGGTKYKFDSINKIYLYTSNGKLLSGADNYEKEKFSIEINVDKETVVFKTENGKYKAKFDRSRGDEKESGLICQIVWEEAPVIMEGFTASKMSDLIVVYNDYYKSATLTFDVDGEIQGTRVSLRPQYEWIIE